MPHVGAVRLLGEWVDFEYEVNGQVYQYSMEGGTSMPLSALIEILHVNSSDMTTAEFMSQIAAVNFSSPALVEVVKTENDWVLYSLQPFETYETLTVTMLDGQQFVVLVTDAQGDPLDSVLTNVTIDGAVTDGTSWTVQKGQTYNLHFSFAETPGDNTKQINLDNPNGVYLTLPNGFQGVTLESATLPLSENGDSLAGNTFSVRDGKIYLNLTEETKEKIRSGNATFTVDIQGIFNSSNSNMEFSTNISRNVTVKEDHDLDVQKSALFQPWDNHIKYTVTVKSDGYNENVVVSDVINGSAVTLEQAAGYGIQVSQSSGTATTVVGQDNKSFTTIFSSLNDGETVTITYYGRLANSANGAAPSAQLTGNTVTGKTGDVTKKDEAHIDNTITWSNISKQAGASSGDGTTKTLPWTITVNASKSEDLSGATVTDHIGSNNMVYDQKTPITVKVYQRNPDNIYYDGDPIQTITVPWDSVTVTPDGKSFTYTLPSKAGNYKYEISYNTKVTVDADSLSSTTVNNGAKVDKDDIHDGTTGTGTVGPAHDVHLQKSVVKVTASTVEWQYSFVIPAGGLSKAELTDYYPHTDTLTDTRDETYTVSVDIQDKQNNEEWTIDYQSDRMVINFTNNGSDGLAGTGAERRVTVKLRTRFNEEWLESDPTASHTNVVDMNGELQAQATVTPGVETGLSKAASSIGKITLDDGKAHQLYKYTLTLTGVNGDVEIVDTFDKDLAYFNIFEYLDNETVNSQFSDLGINLWNDELFYSTEDTSGKRVYPNDYPNDTHPLNNGNYWLGYDRTVTPGTDTNTVKLNVPLNKLPANDSIPYKSYTFVYYLVADNLDSLNQRSKNANGPIELSNTATWTGASDGTSTATVKYQYPVVEKKMTGLGENASADEIQRNTVLPPTKANAKFEIVVNPDRSSMPLDAETGKVKLTDSFENLSVDYSTVHIYMEDENGSRIDVTSSTTWNYSGYKGTFYLNDQTKYVVTYEARIVGEGLVSFNNTAAIDNYTSTVEDSASVGGSGSGEVENNWVRIFKHAGQTMNKPLAGATYTLVNENGDPMVYPTSARNGKVGQPISFTTDATGFARLALSEEADGLSLQKGIKYYLRETAAPAGYQINPRIYNFTISDHPNYNNSVNYEYYVDDIMRFRDNPKEGVLEINKGITVDGVDAGNSLTTEQKKNLKFTISGTRTDGETFETVTVTYDQFKDGKYRLENLKPGTYTVTETNYNMPGLTHVSTTAENTNHNEGETVEDYTFTFTIPSEELVNTEHVVAYTNTYTSTPFSLTVVKKGPDQEKLYGAEFKLEILKDGSYVPLTDNAALNAEGKFTIPYESRESGVTLFSLQDGQYRLTETKAPNGYRATAGEFIFTVSNGTLTSSGIADGNKISYTPAVDNKSGTLSVTNTQEYGYTFTKAEAGATTTRLPHAVFTVYAFDKNQNEGKGEVVETLTTDANGQFEILKSNNTKYQENTLYFVEETTPPQGYEKNTTKYYFYWGNYDLGNAQGFTTSAVNLGSAQMYALVEDEPKNINLKVEKVWSGIDTIPADSIQFKVFRTEITPGSATVKKQFPDTDTVFTLTKGSSETTKWTVVDKAQLLRNLPVGRSEDGVHTSYTYSVEEVTAFTGLESVVTVKKDQWGGDATYDFYTITNRPESVEINIEKIWADNVDHSQQNTTQQIWLYRTDSNGVKDYNFTWDGSKYNAEGASNLGHYQGNVYLTLSNDNGWKAVISGLEKGDPAWTYHVGENTVQGYETPIISDPLSGDGTITVTNPKRTTGIAVKKLWDGIEAENMPESVTVQLMKAGEIEDPDAATVTYYVYNTNWGDNATRHRVTVKNGSSLSVSYNGFAGDCRITQGTGNCETPTYANNKWTIGNITGNIEIGFTTGWGYDQFDSGKSIEYVSGISPDKSTGTPVEGKTLTLNGSTNWYGEWTGLEDGFYYVVETAVGGVELADSGYEVTYSDNNSGIKTGTITMTNTRAELGTLKVKKEVKMTSSMSADSTVFENWNFQIAVKDANGNYYNTNGEVVTGDAKWQTFAYNEEKTWSNLPLGTYMVEENQESASHAPAYALTTSIKVGDQQTSEVQVTAENNSADTATLVTVENAYTRETVSVEVQKVWVDDNNSANIRPSDELWVRLMEGNNQATRVNLAKYSDWHFKQDGLPKYHSNGSLYNYHWVEESVPEGYVLTSATTEKTTSGIITTITNTLNGALKLTKAVTVNGLAPTDANKGMTNGIYEFTIHSVADADNTSNDITVKIKFEDGKATSYQIGSGEAQTVTGTDNTWSVVIPNLTAGDYTITETAPQNGTTLAGIVRGDKSSSSAGNDQQNSNEGEQGNEAAQNPVDLTKRKVTVHVTTGDAVAAQGSAQATFTNNIDEGYLIVHKEVTYNGVAPTTIAQKQVLEGTYTFKLYSDQNCTKPVKNGEEEITLTVNIGPDGIAKDSDKISVPAGTYWLKEIVTEDSYVLPVGENPQEVTISKNDTEVAAKKVNFKNNYELNEEDDKIAVDIVKKFVGLTSEEQIPSGFKVVLSYTDSNGANHTVDLGSSSYEQQDGVQVKFSKSDNKLTWTWHVYNIPKGSTGFSIREENYEKTGYGVAVYLDGKLVQDPGAGQSLDLDAPQAIMTPVPKDRITSEEELKAYYVGSDYVLLVSINPHGTLVISDKSLNFLTRAAIENAVKKAEVQGSYSEPVRFFSTEQHPASIKLDDKRTITVSTDSSGKQTVQLPPRTNSQATGFYVTYDSKPAYNNAEIQNDYTPEGVDIDIIKIEQGNPAKHLPGATFSLRQLADKEASSNGTFENMEGTTPQTAKTDKDGKASFTGLSFGYYELKETASPIGYVMTGDVVVYFRLDEEGIKFLNKDDSETPSKWSTITGAGTGSSLVTFTDAQNAVDDNPNTPENESTAAKNATFTVENTPGTQLPQTGGIGTTLFTALGGLMTATAGAILTIKSWHRRKENA